MNILVLTSIYPADDIAATYTPVVHYFAREWVKQGHNVKVFCSFSTFPKVFYLAARILGVKYLSSKLGYTVMDNAARQKRYHLDGVDVMRSPIYKMLPHGRFTKRAIVGQSKNVLSYCRESNFKPDVIVGHWLNPQLEIITELSKTFPEARTALTLHESAQTLKNLYPRDWRERVAKIDKIGARNHTLRRKLISELNLPIERTYLCLSGIPQMFLRDDMGQKNFNGIKKIAFIGTLFARKYPEAVLKAILKSGKKDFELIYAGDGERKNAIVEIAQMNGVSDKVKLLGKVSRDVVCKTLEDCDCFVMISRNEVYGLVYLEAMSRGCITIASKEEGFDGIIRDGENGFLCEAGNADELANIFGKIGVMSDATLRQISNAAISTARQMTDGNCAEAYLNAILE